MRKFIAFVALLTLAGCCGGSTDIDEPVIDIEPPTTAPVAEPTMDGAGTEESPYVLSCTGNGKDLVGDAGVSFYVTCPADCISAGSVWGSDIYTRDSRVCKAAIHAGAIQAEGGTAEVKIIEGKDSYEGTERNGVTTSDWPSYATSYEFVVAAAAATAAPETLPASKESAGRRGKPRPKGNR